MTTLAPIHPGEHLVEILDELHISQHRLAKKMGMDPIHLDRIIHYRWPITADTARRIGRALGMTPDFWLNLQRMYDLDCARATAAASASESLTPA